MRCVICADWIIFCSIIFISWIIHRVIFHYWIIFWWSLIAWSLWTQFFGSSFGYPCPPIFCTRGRIRLNHYYLFPLPLRCGSSLFFEVYHDFPQLLNSIISFICSFASSCSFGPSSGCVVYKRSNSWLRDMNNHQLLDFIKYRHPLKDPRPLIAFWWN